MAATVAEIMNRELFHLRRGDRVVDARNGILGLGITAAPVLDAAGRPLGVVSLRDLVEAAPALSVEELMSSPAAVVRGAARIRDAARLLGETGYRRLVVVDEQGLAIGMVSAADLVRALVGLPARHPAAFPRLDLRTGLVWTDPAPLAESHVEVAPDGPALLVLLHDVPEQPARVVWAEWTHSARTRLLDWLSLPQESHELARWLARPEGLAFRAAAVSDPESAARIAGELRPHLATPRVAE
jgi:CBS domain-containing protein